MKVNVPAAVAVPPIQKCALPQEVETMPPGKDPEVIEEAIATPLAPPEAVITLLYVEPTFALAMAEPERKSITRGGTVGTIVSAGFTVRVKDLSTEESELSEPEVTRNMKL